MTTVSLSKNNTEFVLNIKDHSKSTRNENGYDLVCCSCSILLFTLLESLQDSILNIDEVKKSLEDCKEPNITIRIKHSDKNEIIIDTILTGYRLLQKNYEKNVKVLSKKL